MKLKINTWLGAAVYWAVILAALSGCVRDDAEIAAPLSGDKVRLTLHTNQPDYALPATRADEPNEAYGGAPMVLVYTGTDGDAVFSEAVLSVTANSATTVTLSKSPEPSMIVLVGNAPATYYNGTTEKTFDAANLTAELDGTKLSQLATLMQAPRYAVPKYSNPTYPGNNPPASCMVAAPGGIDENTDLGSAANKLLLIRMVATVSIQVSPEADYFEMVSVGALKASRTGAIYAYRGSYMIDETDVTDLMIELDTYEGENKVTGPGLKELVMLYLYESTAGQGTVLILQARYHDELCYYKLAFTVDNVPLPVERNKKYIFKIISAKKGFPTVQEAIAGDPWNGIRADIEVVDATGHEIVSNGRYYLAVSNSSVVVYGNETNLTDAFTVTADAHTGLSVTAGTIEFEVTDGTGTILSSTSNIAIGSAPGTATATPVTVTMPAGITSATATLTLGNLTQTVTFERRAAMSGSGITRLNYDDYVSCEIVNRGNGQWLSVSTDGQNEFIDAVTLREPGALFLRGVELNRENTQIGGILMICRMVSGSKLIRSKNYITQNIIVTNPIEHSYVGAFWRYNQTGERLIRIKQDRTSNTITGDWTATVISGKEWIVLDTGTGTATGTNDPGVTYSVGTESPADMNNPNNDDQYSVGSDLITVTGTCTDEIFFRIGLKGTLESQESTPRYGLVLLAYNNNTESHLIYIRQGEAADYLMRNGDPVPNGIIAERTKTAKFSPYNLSSQQYIAGVAGKTGGTAISGHSQLALYGGMFTEYPTQAGAYFQWVNLDLPRYAWHPTNPTGAITGWMHTYPQTFWEGGANLKATHETCPLGYRRFSDDTTTDEITNPAITNSEHRQSLWLNPQTRYANNVDNSVWGYLADGFFDRHCIVTSLSGAVNSAVSITDHKAGYIGRLFYNPYNNASLFFPASGRREYESGELLATGTRGFYWSTSSYSLTRNWYLWIGDTDAHPDYSVRSVGYSIRCVKE